MLDKNKPLANLLLVEDDSSIQLLLEYHLNRAGYQLTTFSNAEDAYSFLLHNPVDLLILDWMLPRLSGAELCRRVRKQDKFKELLIILLTARASELDIVHGLGAGADDYVAKPFSVVELLARIKALLRRSKRQILSNLLTYKDLSFDIHAHKVTKAGLELLLGPSEYKLLEFFMRYPTKVFSRSQLVERLWGMDSLIDERTVDVHILRLRKALAKVGGEDYIKTVRGFGYVLN